MGQNRKICVGAFHGPHGVRGQLRLASYTDDPVALFDYVPLSDEKDTKSFDIKKQGVAKKGFIVSVGGVADRNAAEALRGTKLFVDRDMLPETESDEGEYYFSDLLGLKVKDQEGKEIGEVQAVHDFGAGDILEIRPAEGKSFMLPFKEDFIPVIDIDAGVVEAIVPDGWLKDEKQPKEQRMKLEDAPKGAADSE